MFSEDDVLKLSIHGFNNLKWAFIFNIPTMSVSQKLYLKNSGKPVYFVQVLSLIVYDRAFLEPGSRKFGFR
jgi:tellurite resistance protein TehA-like permease